MGVIEPTSDLELWIVIVVASLLVAIGTFTLAVSIYYQVADRRREAVGPDVRFGMLERMSTEDPDWETWVDDLSDVERERARTELESYLRSTDGEEYDRLRGCGEALGIPGEAKAMLTEGKQHEKLQALTWLTLLEIAPAPATLREICTDDTDLRAAGARVLQAAGHPEAQSVGTELLLGDGDLRLSVYGLDTLYQLHRTNPTPLFDRAAAAYEDWRPSLIIQVLLVLRHCSVAGRHASRDWIVELTGHELSSVRAAAITALEPEGWQADLRETVDVDRLLTDPETETRRAGYAMLAAWNDQPALEALAEGAIAEPDQRARVGALEPLVDRPDLASPAAAGVDDDRYERAWSWVLARASLETDA